MRKLFINQPIKGKMDEEILAIKEKATESAKEYLGESVEVVDSFFQNASADVRPLWYLGKSPELLATADAAYFTPGWETAKGHGTENTCAAEYGIDAIEDHAECTECLVSFDKAIEALKTGCKMARKDWNGKDQHIQLATNISYLDADGNAVNAEHEATRNKTITSVGAFGVQMGWLASQTDMLAEDWKVMER